MHFQLAVPFEEVLGCSHRHRGSPADPHIWEQRGVRSQFTVLCSDSGLAAGLVLALQNIQGAFLEPFFLLARL